MKVLGMDVNQKTLVYCFVAFLVGYFFSRFTQIEGITNATCTSEQEEQFEEFQENHRKFEEKGVKAAGGRARKAIGEIKKLVTGYRQASVSESK